MATSKKRDKPLTREEVLDAALKIVDSEGLAALTMRHLADAVGVEAMSLYHYVPNKEALLDGVVERTRAEVRPPDPVPDDWIDIMEAIFGEYRRVLARHPNTLPLAGRRTPGESHQGLLFLIDQGFERDDAVELWQSLIAFTVGYSMFSSPYAETDTSGLPPRLAKRMDEWRDETCYRTLRVILEGYESATQAGPK